MNGGESCRLAGQRAADHAVLAGAHTDARGDARVLREHRRVDRDGGDQTFPADLPHQRLVGERLTHERLEVRLELGDALDQPLALEDVDRREARGARRRVPAVGVAVAPDGASAASQNGSRTRAEAITAPSGW